MDRIREDREQAEIYRQTRIALEEILKGYELSEGSVDYILSDLDQLISVRLKNIVILPKQKDSSLEGEDSEEPTSSIASQIEMLETGIFNFIVSLCMLYTDTVRPEVARLKVIEYLERITQGLQTVDEQTTD